MKLEEHKMKGLRRKFNDIAFGTDSRTLAETSLMRDAFIQEIVDEAAIRIENFVNAQIGVVRRRNAA